MDDAICWIFIGMSICLMVGIIVFIRWRRNRLRIWLSNHPAECFFDSLKWLKDREKGRLKMQNEWIEALARKNEEIAALKAERDLLKKHQAVCECGGLSIDHNISDNHQVSDMISPCPFKEQIAALKEAMGAPTVQDSGFPYSIIGRLSALTRKIVGESWRAKINILTAETAALEKTATEQEEGGR